MLRFLNVGEYEGPKQERMSLEEYAAFSEACLRGNRRISPETCLRRDEGIKRPFSLREGLKV